MNYSVNQHSERAQDGWCLDILDLKPLAPIATVVCGHAMMVDRRTLWRPDRTTLADTLANSGLRVLIPDLRGHGQSGPLAADGGDWTYEDLIADTDLYINLAKRLEPDLPVYLLGHSLFGHTSLAYLGRKPTAPVDGLIAYAVNIWTMQWTISASRRLLKRGFAKLSERIVAAKGFLPARSLKVGSNDEAPGYWMDFVRFVLSNTWGPPDGSSYYADLHRIPCPVLHVVSEGDRLYAHPDEALQLTDPIRTRRTILRVGAPGCPVPTHAFDPDHMALVTDARSHPVWDHTARWIKEGIREG